MPDHDDPIQRTELNEELEAATPVAPETPAASDAPAAEDSGATGIPDVAGAVVPEAEAAPQDQPGEQVMTIMADVERQLDRLRSLQTQQTDEVTSLSQRSADLDERQRELDERESALTAARETFELESEQAHGDLAASKEALEGADAEARAALAEANERAEALEQQAADIAEREEKATARQREIEDRMEQLGRDQKAFETEQDEARASVRAEREAFAEQMQAAETAGEQSRTERESLEKQRDQVEQASAEMDKQRDEMHARHAELEETLESMRAERETLENESQRLAEERAALQGAQAAQRQELESREKAVEDAEHGAARVTELEQERDDLLLRIEEAEQATASLQANLSKARDELEAATAACERADTAAEERVTSAISEIETLQAERQETLDKLSLLEQEHAQQQQTSTERIEVLEQDVAAAKEKSREAAAALEETKRSLEQQADIVGQRTAEAGAHEEKLASAREEIETKARELTDLRAKLEERDEELVGAQRGAEKASELQAQLNDANSKLQMTGEKMTKFSEMLAQQGELIEQGAAAIATVDQQREEIERLRDQLAESRLAGDTDEMHRREERIKQLTEALRQARGQAGTKNDVLDLELRATELGKENDELRAEAQRFEVENGELRRQAEARIEEVGAQARDESTFEVERVEFEERITGLEEKLEAAEATNADLMEQVDSRGKEGPEDAAVRERARRVAEVAAHLKRRQLRLKRARRLVKSGPRKHQAGNAGGKGGPEDREAVVRLREERAEIMRKGSEQRLKLSDAHQRLVKTEKRMIKKWARPRAYVIAGWFFFMMALNAVGAWLAADHFFPSHEVASATMRAKGFTSLEELEATEWVTWHRELLLSGSFHETLASRMRERRIDAYKTPDAVADLISSVAVDAGVPGKLTFSLETTNGPQGVLLMEMLTTTISTESRRAHGKSDTGQIAIIEQAPQAAAGEARVATIGPFPVIDDRIYFAGLIFGGASVVTLMIVMFLYARLARARRLFDAEDDLFDEEGATVHAIA